MAKEYDTYVDDPTDFKIKEAEMDMIIRDLTPDNRREKYGSRRVRAVVMPKPEAGGDVLYLRYQRGSLYPEKFGIKILG
ncbi:MAG: hypothetical protein SV775_16095 [Thermodesulfobacteriota bacterium]|nr:hypothetical protein [Thermodesulfobacteriota bacterium]